mmetsp:Transcript_1774/g.5837  ORF Transcript_1774/g.5837 Transcript_1774/m.5837 type:complete len:223 (+) Transcript_1774:89-757(+)
MGLQAHGAQHRRDGAQHPHRALQQRVHVAGCHSLPPAVLPWPPAGHFCRGHGHAAQPGLQAPGADPRAHVLACGEQGHHRAPVGHGDGAGHGQQHLPAGAPLGHVPPLLPEPDARGRQEHRERPLRALPGPRHLQAAPPRLPRAAQGVRRGRRPLHRGARGGAGAQGCRNPEAARGRARNHQPPRASRRDVRHVSFCEEPDEYQTAQLGLGRRISRSHGHTA